MGITKLDYFEAKLDDKKRLTVPTDLQGEFGGAAVITFGFGSYLHLYSAKAWYEEVEPAIYAGALDEATADKAAQLNKGKTDQELDRKQGRLLLKKHLLEWAGINKEVCCTRVGFYWRIEAKEKAR